MCVVGCYRLSESDSSDSESSSTSEEERERRRKRRRQKKKKEKMKKKRRSSEGSRYCIERLTIPPSPSKYPFLLRPILRDSLLIIRVSSLVFTLLTFMLWKESHFLYFVYILQEQV